jgi:hypothetical protein
MEHERNRGLINACRALRRRRHGRPHLGDILGKNVKERLHALPIHCTFIELALCLVNAVRTPGCIAT